VPHVLSRAREALATPILEHHYMQWIAHTQWMRAREAMKTLGVELMGDLPFIVCGESGRVGEVVAVPSRRVARRAAGRLHAGRSGLGSRLRLGRDERGRPQVAPRADAPRGASLRSLPVDHVVGYFRMYVRKPGERGYFDPEGSRSSRRTARGCCAR